MYDHPQCGFRILKKVAFTHLFSSCCVPFYCVAVFQFVVLPYRVII